ncbi:MAG: hypothetical protein IPM79_34065 [Polyangiaceae bacterium]|jgi:hypothetical protein|nr:hypothetical protein [Polyangiaceae bacterium]MBK8942492.1 hypothetical protein [Polyangiaceae bacterium]
MNRSSTTLAALAVIATLVACGDKSEGAASGSASATDKVAQEAYDFSTKWDEACKQEDKKKAAADAQLVIDEAVKNPVFKEAYEAEDPKKYADACGRMMRVSTRATLSKKLKGS